MKTLLLLLLLALPLALPAQNLKMGHPTPEELSMTTYDPDPEAEAVVLMQERDLVNKMTSYYNVNFSYVEKLRIKVLKESGKKYGDFSILYRDSKDPTGPREEFYEFKAVAYNLDDNGQIVPSVLPSTLIFDERLDEDYKVRKFSIPQVKVGTVIELEYELFSPIYYQITDYPMQREIPVEYARCHMDIPTVVIFNVQAPVNHPNVQAKVEVGRAKLAKEGYLNTNVYTVEARHMPALRADDYVWCIDDYRANIVCDLTKTNFPNAVTQARRRSWDDIDDLLLRQKEIGSRLSDKGRLDKAIQEAGIAQLPTQRERIEAAVTLLSRQVVWNGDYDLLPHSAQSVLKKRSGSTADVNMLLISMFNDLGMKAWPVFLGTRRMGRLPIHPSVKALNCMIVAVQTDEGLCYVDATDPLGAINVLRPNLYVQEARVMGKKRKGEFVDLTAQARSRMLASTTLQVQADGSFQGDLHVTYDGNAARTARYEYHSAQDSATYATTLEEAMGCHLTSLILSGQDAYRKDMTLQAQFQGEGTTNGDLIYINPFVLKPLDESPFKAETRILPVELPYRENNNYTVTIQLPAGYAVEEVPRSFEVSTPDQTVQAIFRCDFPDGQVRVSFRFIVNSLTFEPRTYKALKTVYDRAAERLNDLIVLKKL